MKRGIVLAAVCAALLASCAPPTAQEVSARTEAAQKEELAPRGLYIWVDGDTGCQYFVPYMNSEYGMMPRTSPDGFHQLCGGAPG